MEKSQFWSLIAKSKKAAKNSDEQVKLIQNELAKMQVSDIVDFQRYFDECLKEAYQWNLWAAAYIIKGGGCSDDSFDYFMGWLVAQGEDYFKAAVANPERAGDAVNPGDDIECEILWYAPANAYEAKTGKDDFFAHCHPIERELIGVPFDEENVEELYPALAKKFMA